MKLRLIVMNFLQFAVWGAYLTCMGTYLSNIGMSTNIGIFYSIQGIVSIFMPALIGIIADRWIPAQRMLGISHAIAGVAMIAAGYYGLQAGNAVEFPILFSLYTVSVAFYMPTLALSNSVAYNALEKAGMDTVKDFPPIRVFGTVGFICSMWTVDLLGFQTTAMQFIVSGTIGLVLAIYSFTLPHCPISKGGEKNQWQRHWVSRHLPCSNRKRWPFSSSFPCCSVCHYKLPTDLPILSSPVSAPLKNMQIHSAYNMPIC